MSATAVLPAGRRDASSAAVPATPAVASVRAVRRTFGDVVALRDVSLTLASGEIHALVGPNGAGKTTLLRILTGLVDADEGTVDVCGRDPARAARAVHRELGVVHSGTRSFYLRISGVENLVFFARLHGLRKRAAVARAHELLEAVDLTAAASRPVSTYSTGMHRRLAVARALIGEPRVLLVDEATHDLDPEAATRVRALIRRASQRGAGVLWTTQRLEEIRGFADQVTLLDRGSVAFAGSVPALLEHAPAGQYLLRVAPGRRPPPEVRRGERVLCTVERGDVDGGHYLVSLEPGATLGAVFVALAESGVDIVGCTEAKPSIEEAFLALIARSGA